MNEEAIIALRAAVDEVEQCFRRVHAAVQRLDEPSLTDDQKDELTLIFVRLMRKMQEMGAKNDQPE